MESAGFRSPRVPALIAGGLLGVQLVNLLTISGLQGLGRVIGAIPLRAIEVEEALISASAGLFWLTAVAFLFWFHRVHRNLAALDTEPLHTSRFAVGAWFIPLAGLWLPVQVALDIWRKSVGPPSDDTGLPISERGAWIVVWWWATFIGSRIATPIVDGIMGPSAPADLVLELAVFANVLRAVAAGFALAVVVGITQRQERTASRAPTSF